MMSGYKKIYTFGDGYATSHIWPEWPAILEALLPHIVFQHFAGIGAGNEFVLNSVIQAYQEDPDAYFLVQWCYPYRFDKLLQDNSWNDIIDSDPVYHFNRVTMAHQHWWLSSASTVPDIQHYHNHFVQGYQSMNRTLNAIYLAGKLLVNQSLFFSVALNMQQLKSQTPLYFQNINMIDQDLREYSLQPRFAHVRQNQVQPSPSVHLSYLIEHVLPRLPFEVDQLRLQKLQQRIRQHSWQAYDPDRQEIWNNMRDL